MRLRAMFSGLVGGGLALALMPLGCGAAQEEYTVVRQAQSEASSSSNEWTVPEVHVEQLRGCLMEHASDLKTYSHEAKFDVKVNEQGEVQRVGMNRSTMHHASMESCMMRVLASLTIPLSVIPLRSSEPVSGGESMRHSNEPGIVQAIGGVALGPIIVVALGVTLTLYVVAAATEETIEAVKRTRKLERMCQALLVECISDKRLPPDSDFGTEKQCEFCHGLCLNEGYWPEDKCPRPTWRKN